MPESVDMRELAFIMLENFLFMTFLSGGLGFTISSAGIVEVQHGIYTYTVAFSFLWGLVGAAAAWSRKRDSIKIPRLFTSILEKLGLETKDLKGFDFKTCGFCSEIFSRVFIPFVHTPKC